MGSQDTDMGGSRKRFPTTRWTDVLAAQVTDTSQYHQAFGLFVRRYWKPVYCYIRRRGRSNEQAKDLTQEFFISWLEDRKLARADPQRGRFRTFILTCLQRFLIAQGRREHARRRLPPEGVVSIDRLVHESGELPQADDSLTPEAAFGRAWALSVLEAAVAEVERYCGDHSLQPHYEMLRRRLVMPVLEGADVPPLRLLAEEFGLSEKEVANRLQTAKHLLRRALQQQAAHYATSSAEVTSEMRSLRQLLAGRTPRRRKA